MNIWITQIILLFLSFNTYADSSDNQTLLASRPDGSKINYYHFKEAKNLRSKVLLLVLQGSDCNSVVKIESIFSDYKNVWPKADLLLIEKYGIDMNLSYSSSLMRKDCPLEYLKKDSPEQRVMDIKMVLDAIRKNGVYERLVVIGGSEGAVIANLLAASIDYVDATISFNGGGRRFIDDVLHNIASEPVDDEEKKKNIEGFKGFSEHVLNSEPFDLEVSGHGYRWWRQMLLIDQYSVLGEVKSPLLVVQGGIDLSVSPQKVDDLMLALRESENKHIEYFTYPKLDHGFNNAEGRNELKKVIIDMNAWLKKTLYSPTK
jgi:dienelactone hydrolase